MATREFLKDKKIGVYKKVKGYDKDGFPIDGYMPVHEQPSLWAYFKQLSASLLYANSSTTDKEDCYFRINWNEYIRNAYATDLSVGYRGKVYQVTRIDPFEDYRRDLVLYAHTTNTGKLSPVIPYDPKKL